MLQYILKRILIMVPTMLHPVQLFGLGILALSSQRKRQVVHRPQRARMLLAQDPALDVEYFPVQLFGLGMMTLRPKRIR